MLGNLNDSGTNFNKTILILGAGVMQKPAIEIAKSQGWRVCVVDGNKHAPYCDLADHFFVADLKFSEEVIAIAEKWNSEFGIDGVFTAGTDFSLTVAKTAQALGTPSISVESALMATDKGLMREAFRCCGVSIPKFYVLEKQFGLTLIDQIKMEEKNFPSYPVVVKPVDNMGARGIVRCDNSEDLFNKAECAMNFSRTDRIIIEEYIEGAEFSVDAIVENGVVTICGFAERHIFFPPYFIEMGHTIPANGPPEFEKLMIDEFKKGVKSLGIENGTAKGDIKLEAKEGSKPRAVIGEIAARLSGGYMSGWTYPYSSGVHPVLYAMRISLGLTANIPKPLHSLICVERAFISMVGSVKEIIIPNKSQYPEVKKIFLRINKGDKVSFPTNNVEKCGNVLVVGEKRENLEEIASKLLSKIIIRLDPFDKDTELWMIKGITKVKPPLQFNILEIKKDDNKCFIFRNDMPMIKGGVTDLCFWVNSDFFEIEGSDWHGRDFRQVWSELVEFGLVAKPDVKISSKQILAEIPLVAWFELLSRGSIQGMFWLSDRVSQELKEGRFDFVYKLGGLKCEGF